MTKLPKANVAKGKDIDYKILKNVTVLLSWVLINGMMLSLGIP
jgi:hypothetical protein